MKQRLLLSILLAGFLFFALPARDAHAQFVANFDDGMAAFNYGDNDLAARHFMKLAHDGDQRAQYYLAYMMDAGLGLGKDLYGATTWYRKSAEQSYLPAIVYMGYIYSAGHGATQDDRVAFKWYTKAAQMGDAIAQNNLATMLRAGRPYARDAMLAAQWFLQASMQGNMRAQFNLATMYRVGDGIKKNYPEAVRWYTYAANQGDMYAQYALGYMYYLGQGVDKDPAQALEWFRRAAEQGHLASQMMVAHMYENGEGGPDKSIDDAVIWYFHAANAGNERAMQRLGKMYEDGPSSDGKGLPKDPKEAFKWYRKAAEEKGYYPSMLSLGHLYETNKRPELQKALDWYRRVAESGDPLGMMEMARLYQVGAGVVRDAKLAYFWYLLASKYFRIEGEDPDSFATAIRNSTSIGIGIPAGDKQAVKMQIEQWRPVVRNSGAVEKPKFQYDK